MEAGKDKPLAAGAFWLLAAVAALGAFGMVAYNFLKEVGRADARYPLSEGGR